MNVVPRLEKIEPFRILALVRRQPDLLALVGLDHERERQTAGVIGDLEVAAGRQRLQPDQTPVIDEPLARVALAVGEGHGQPDRVSPVEGAYGRLDRGEVGRVATQPTDLEPTEQDAIALRPPREGAGLVDGEQAGQLGRVGVERPRAAVGDERDGLGRADRARASLRERRAVGEPRAGGDHRRGVRWRQGNRRGRRAVVGGRLRARAGHQHRYEGEPEPSHLAPDGTPGPGHGRVVPG